jgi:dTDP-glucose 4,6-dehydratase
VQAATKDDVGETYNIGGINEKQNIEVVNSHCAILDDQVPQQTAGVRNENCQTVYDLELPD